MLVADDKKDEKIDPEKLVGKWEKKKEDATIELAKDGTATITMKGGGKESMKYKVEGGALVLTAEKFGQMMTLKMPIAKLTDTEMVIKDEKTGKEEVFVRIKEKK